MACVFLCELVSEMWDWYGLLIGRSLQFLSVAVEHHSMNNGGPDSYSVDKGQDHYTVARNPPIPFREEQPSKQIA